MTVEELEIIVRAKVEEAMKNIKKLTKEVKSQTKEMETAIKGLDFSKVKVKLDFSQKLDESAKKTMQDYKKQVVDTVQKTKKEVEKIEIKPKLKAEEIFNFDADKMSSDEIEKKMEDLRKIRDSLMDDRNMVSEEDEKLFDSIVSKVCELQQMLPYVRSDELKLESLDFLNEEIAPPKPVADISKVEETPEVQEKSVLDINSQLEEIRTLKDAWLNAIVTIKNEYKNIGKGGLGAIKNSMAIPFDMMKEKVTGVKGKIEELKEKFNKPIEGVKKFTSKLDKIKEKFKEVSKHSKKLDLGSALEKGLKSIKKFTLSLLSVKTAYQIISRAAQSYLSFDETLNQSLQNSWNTLGSLLAPALEVVVNLFAQATSYVAAFVKALTEVDLVARANTKALDKQNKSASQTKGLSSIDDISNLSSGSGSGDNSVITTMDIDDSKMNTIIDKLRKKLSELFEPVKKSWDKYGQYATDSIKNAFNGCIELTKAIGSSLEEVWLNGTGETFVDNLLIGFGNVFNIIGNIKSSIAEVWTTTGLGTEIIQLLFDIINDGIEIVNTIGGYFASWTVSDTFKNTIASIMGIVKDIVSFVSSIGESLLNWVISEDFQVALDKVFVAIDDIFEIAKNIMDWVLSMYDKYLKPVIDEKLLPALTEVVNAIMDIWNVIKPVIDWAIEQIKRNLEPVIQNLSQVIGGIIDIVRGIAEFISGVFTGDWEKAWSGIKKIFSGFLDAIAGLVKAPFNIIIGIFETLINLVNQGVNFVKKQLNKLSFDIPDWVPVIGGKTWGFSFTLTPDTKLPRLASGHVATEPLIAEIGEYSNAKSNPEIVSPLSIMKQAFRDVLSEMDFGGTRVDKLVVDVAGKNFYDDSIDYINRKTTRRGVSVVKEGAY